MKEHTGEGGSKVGLSVFDTSDRAGDGSGTSMFDGIAGLLGVPTSGFHLSSNMLAIV